MRFFYAVSAVTFAKSYNLCPGTERAVYDKGVTIGAIPLAAPFAAAEGISPEVWKAIGIFLGAGR